MNDKNEKNSRSRPLLYEKAHDVSDALTAFYVSGEGRSGSVADHFHRKPEMVYILSGNITVTVGDKIYEGGADDIFFARSYAKHAYRPSPAYKKLVLIVPPSFCRDFSAALEGAALPPLMGDRAFNKTLLPFFSAVPGDAAGDAVIERGYINIIFGKLISHYPPQPVIAGSGERLIIDILDYIEHHYPRPLSLDSLAAAFDYNRYYISKIWSQNIGQNLNTYINNIRLRHLVSQAAQGGAESITDLAYSCGFSSLTTFYRCFMNLYKVTPKQYFKGLLNTV